MWITLLAMAVAISLEPFRIGLAVVMLHRPRPVVQMCAFLCGGYAMGLTVGIGVLFALRPHLPQAPESTLPTVQLVVGTVALVIAAVVAARGLVGPKGDRSDAGAPSRLAAVSRRLVAGGSPWVAGTAGLGIALPSVDYLAVLAVIGVSGTGAVTQFGALLVFHVVAFALVEIPLAAYLLTPRRTLAVMTALNAWMRSRRRRDVAALLALFGCMMIGIGVVGL